MFDIRGQAFIARLSQTLTVPGTPWVRGRILEYSETLVSVALCGDISPEPTGECIVVELKTLAHEGWRFFSDEELWESEWKHIRDSGSRDHGAAEAGRTGSR